MAGGTITVSGGGRGPSVVTIAALAAAATAVGLSLVGLRGLRQWAKRAQKCVPPSGGRRALSWRSVFTGEKHGGAEKERERVAHLVPLVERSASLGKVKRIERFGEYVAPTFRASSRHIIPVSQPTVRLRLPSSPIPHTSLSLFPLPFLSLFPLSFLSLFPLPFLSLFPLPFLSLFPLPFLSLSPSATRRPLSATLFLIPPLRLPVPPLRLPRRPVRQLGLPTDLAAVALLAQAADDYVWGDKSTSDKSRANLLALVAQTGGGSAEGEAEAGEELGEELIAELDACMLSYFGFHWPHSALMIEQVFRGPSSKLHLRDAVNAVIRQRRFNEAITCLRPQQRFSQLLEEMKFPTSSPSHSPSHSPSRSPSHSHSPSRSPSRPRPSSAEVLREGEVMVPAAAAVRSPVLLLIGGGMGAGKSTVVKEIMKRTLWARMAPHAPHAVVVEAADTFKEKYANLRALSVPSSLVSHSRLFFPLQHILGAHGPTCSGRGSRHLQGNVQNLQSALLCFFNPPSAPPLLSFPFRPPHSTFWARMAPHAVVVEADAFKEKDAIFRALSAERLSDAARISQLVHEESTRAAQSTLVTALNEGRDVIFDGTMSWAPFVQQTIAMARRVHERRFRMGPGYQVKEDGSVVERYWEEVEEGSEGGMEEGRGERGEEEGKISGEEDGREQEGGEEMGSERGEREEERRRDQPGKEGQHRPKRHSRQRGAGEQRLPYRIELVGVMCDAHLAVVRGMRRAILTKIGVPVHEQLRSHKLSHPSQPNPSPRPLSPPTPRAFLPPQARHPDQERSAGYKEGTSPPRSAPTTPPSTPTSMITPPTSTPQRGGVQPPAGGLSGISFAHRLQGGHVTPEKRTNHPTIHPNRHDHTAYKHAPQHWCHLQRGAHRLQGGHVTPEKRTNHPTVHPNQHDHTAYKHAPQHGRHLQRRGVQPPAGGLRGISFGLRLEARQPPRLLRSRALL
ncbi:unnamed protein product [Closterium sp. Naga37s-1]|nr:unnamed protein product [Closterium sp. Naga37s-1]